MKTIPQRELRNDISRILRVELANTFAELAAVARRQGRRPKIMDSWIAATAVAHDLMLCTQDNDFDDIPQVRVLRD
jgi:predicted nucleic acid-binding protein